MKEYDYDNREQDVISDAVSLVEFLRDEEIAFGGQLGDEINDLAQSVNNYLREKRSEHP